MPAGVAGAYGVTRRSGPIAQPVGTVDYPNDYAYTRQTDERYRALADATDGVHFVGRLATYRYYKHGPGGGPGAHRCRPPRHPRQSCR